MHVRLISLITAFSFVITTAQPYSKADLKKVENAAVAGAVVPTIGKVLAGNNGASVDMQHIGMFSTEIYAIVSSALENGTLIMNIRTVLEKTIAEKNNGVLSSWNQDESTRATEQAVVAIANELSQHLTGKLTTKLLGENNQRMIRRAARITAGTLTDGLVTFVALWSLNKIHSTPEAGKLALQDSLTAMAASFAKNTTYEIAGELLARGSSDEAMMAEEETVA